MCVWQTPKANVHRFLQEAKMRIKSLLYILVILAEPGIKNLRFEGSEYGLVGRMLSLLMLRCFVFQKTAGS
jgi:hypothetical protein